MASTTVLGVFNSAADASQALADLRSSGIHLLDTALKDENNVQQQEMPTAQEARAGKAMLIVKVPEEQALDLRRILVQHGATALHENETDMLGGGLGTLMVENGFGGPVPRSAIASSDPDIEPVPNTLQVASTATYEREIAANHEVDLDESTPPKEVLEADDPDTATTRPGTTMENGARVVSYEQEAKKQP